MNAPPLDVLQRWMLAVIQNPQGVEPGLATPRAQQEIPLPPGHLEQVILPSSLQSSVQRLQVYQQAYFARLLECLQAEFPALCVAAGEEAFRAFARDYLQAFPSRSYTLTRLGDRFPEFLASSRPVQHSASATPDWTDFLVDLARLERCYNQVFDGPGEEQTARLTGEALQEIASDQWPLVRLQTSQALRLEQFHFPVHRFATAVRKQQIVKSREEAIRPQPTWLCISRANFIVRRRELTSLQFALLSAIQRGERLIDALAIAIETTSEAPGSPLDIPDSARLTEWFRDWTSLGLFTEIRLDGI